MEVVEEIVEVEEDDDEGSDGGEEARAKRARSLRPATRATIASTSSRRPSRPSAAAAVTHRDRRGDAGDFIEHAEFWGDVVGRNAEPQDVRVAVLRGVREDPIVPDMGVEPGQQAVLAQGGRTGAAGARGGGRERRVDQRVLPQRKGPTVKHALAKDVADPTLPPKCLHTVLTSSGNAYMNWQTRIMYQTYLKHAAEPGSVMKAFTRILHRGKDDELMMEVPTMRFDPNQGKCDTWCDYPVADRSLAVAQWSQTTDSMRCSHVMMVETDYIYVKSPSPHILMPRGKAIGFEYSYIYPQDLNMKRVYEEYMREHADELGRSEWKREKFALPRTGNAPSCLNVEDLRRVAPLWAEFVARTEKPEEVRKALGWLRDMYAYDAAALAVGVEHVVAPTPRTPPWRSSPRMRRSATRFCCTTRGDRRYTTGRTRSCGCSISDRTAEVSTSAGPYQLSKIPDPPRWDPAAGCSCRIFFHEDAEREQAGAHPVDD